MAVDTTNCDREPIHIPGSIQPHGVLLGVDPQSRRIAIASENTGALLGAQADSLPGRPLDELLGPGITVEIESRIGRDESEVGALRVDVATPAEPRAFDAIAHRSEGLTVVELEPSADLSPVELDALLVRLRAAFARIHAAQTVHAACEAALDEFVAVSGFDRTMVYRFDRDWHGEVIAERLLDAALTPFLGLHYPASDIPRQARELYTRNVLRVVPDASYAPARLVPGENPLTGRPLDLSRSRLRSVSPIHLEYMRNMGTAASLTVSLLRRGELWGMISAHHGTARYLPYRQRVACDLIARAASLQIAALEDRADFEYRMRIRAMQPSLIEAIDREGEFLSAIDNNRDLLAIVDAEGAAFKGEGEPVLIGSTPPSRDVRRIIAWLRERGGDDAEPFVTDELPLMNPDFGDLKDVACGLLAVPLATAAGGWLMWFRPEAERTVTWGGDPRKSIAEDGRISPRRSFERWKETVQLHSRPWLDAQIDSAIEVRRLLSDVMMRRAREYAALNAELARSNAELESFAYVASHDLKEPLRGIHNYAEFLTQDYARALDEDGLRMLDAMKKLVLRMQGQIDSMLQLARVGAAGEQVEPVAMDEALDAALALLGPVLAAGDVELVRAQPLGDALMNASHAREVFLNLIGNAIKYNTSARKRVEIGVAGAQASERPLGDDDAITVTYFVRDNGIGIPLKHAETVFRMFKRLHPQDRFGGGSGAGLAIARKIVEQYGGRMWVEPGPNGGSTFFFTAVQAGG